MDWDAIPWIQCIDANGRSELSNYDMWVEYANRTVKESIYGGELAASESAKVLCHNFNIQAPARQVFHGPPGANETSNPLLFLSSRADPVTPLRAARKMVKRFGGAALLVQNSVGHATLSAESACKDEYLHRYFETGELPAEGTICESEDVPFKSVGKPGEKRMKWFARDHFPL
jgi:pimeloyl-ACP methyl ester carboxylesterase